MPFFGLEFFQAVEGYPDSVALGYMRAVWHYWHHEHCGGLPDDDDFLMRLCRIDRVEWVRAKSIIFGRFFNLERGKWHQKRAREIHEKIQNQYMARVNQTRAATAARMENRGGPPPRRNG